MKKLSMISVAALMLASCSNEEVVPAGEGQEQQVTISLELPAEINSRATGATTSADGGLTNVKDKGLTFNVALYSTSNTEPVFVGTKTVGVGESVASFTPTVVLGKKYQVVAYASYDESIAWGDGAASVTTTQVINDEAEDAYFCNATIQAAASMKATLTRPYGKLRIVANDYAEAIKEHYGNQDVTSVKVVYANGQSTEFNPQSGEFTEVTAGEALTLNADAIKYDGEADAKTILADYIPAASSEEATIVTITSVEVTVGNETYTKVLNMDVPVKRNCLTTLSGDFFTSDAVLDLIVKDIFVTDSEINYKLAAAIANGGVVVLTEDVIVKKPLEITTANPVVIDLNGHTITGEGLVNQAVIYVTNEKANVTIKGEGTVTTSSAYPVAVNGANAVVTIEGGNYTATNSSQAAYAQAGTIYIKGGYFQVDSKYGDKAYIDGNGNGMYVLNCQDASYDNGTANIVVTGGSFYKFDPSSNVAEKRTNKPTSNFVPEGYNVAKVGDVYVVVEGKVTVADTQEELTAALAEGGTVVVAAGNYAIPESFAKDVVIKGVSKENTVFNMSKSSYAENTSVSFENLTINLPTGLSYTEQAFGFFHRIETLNVEDCVINGGLRVNVYGVATIKDCVFNTSVSSGFDGYPLYYYGSTGSKMNVIGCEFNTVSKGIVMYNEGAQVFDLNVEDCKFVASKKDDKAAIQMHTEYGISGTVNIKNTTATGFADVNGGLWNEINNNTKVQTDVFDITVDGVQVH